MIKSRKTDKTSQGFTIVELMISLSILSIILVIAAVVMINISSLYSKGVNGANLQNSARNIVADITSNLQFSGYQPYGCTLNGTSSQTLQASTTCYANDYVPPDPTNTGPFVFCIGTTRYTYLLNTELGLDNGRRSSPATQHVLWRDILKDPSQCLPVTGFGNPIGINGPNQDSAAVNNSGYEMVGPKMRLTRFEIYAPAGSDIFTVEIWMAYGDSDLVSSQSMNSSNPGYSICQGNTGTQYCAISEITTAVKGRVY